MRDSPAGAPHHGPRVQVWQDGGDRGEGVRLRNSPKVVAIMWQPSTPTEQGGQERVGIGQRLFGIEQSTAKRSKQVTIFQRNLPKSQSKEFFNDCIPPFPTIFSGVRPHTAVVTAGKGDRGGPFGHRQGGP